MRPRIFVNGTIVFPKRGKPPPVQQGFIRDCGDPFTFHPLLPACKYRVIDEIYFQKCGCTGKRITCKLYKTINMTRCYTCQSRV